jgi:hypothetical protein
VSVNDITGAVRRRKAQFYLVEHFPLTLVAARRLHFPRQVPPFKWVIAVLSDVRAVIPSGLCLCVVQCAEGG